MNSPSSSRRRGVLICCLSAAALLVLCPGRYRDARAAGFIRGDTDQTGLLNITDGIRVFGYLFLGDPTPSCLDALDVDDNSRIDITDGIVVLNFLFAGGPAPRPPFPECGLDPTGDDLTCKLHASCPASDATQPVVRITSPQNLLVVGDPELTVLGTAGDEFDPLEDLTVTVNQEPAALDTATGEFLAHLTLREGTNVITAVATDPAGNAGAATISVMLDTQPPTVTVETPPPRPPGEPGPDFTTDQARVTVTGFLNDIGSAQAGGAAGRVTVLSVTQKGTPIAGPVDASLEGKAFLVLDFPLRVGLNVIRVQGTDGVGNPSAVAERTVLLREITGQRIRRVSGDSQAAPILTVLPEPLVVLLADRDGRPVPGRTVKFEVVRNSGLLSASADALTRARELFVRTGASGTAAAFLTLGDRIGAGFNRVRATAAGFEGEVLFCATALAGLPAKILAVEGPNQTGIPGQALPRPLVALAVDEQGNPIPSLPITFEVLAGGGTVSLGGTSGAGAGGTLVVPTNEEGLAAAVFHLGLVEGINAHVAVARFESLAGLSATYYASAKMPRPAQETAVVGVVLDNSDVPLEAVTMRLFTGAGTLETLTDSQGLFRIEPAPVGTLRLQADGSTTTRPGTWPRLEFDITTISGQENGVGEPIRLPEVDEDGSFLVGGDETVVVTMEGVPGMSLTVFPNSVTFPNGDREGRISLSQVKLDKVPMPPPNGSIFMPPAWTVQPPGVFFDPPARVSIPNDGLPAGRIIDIFQFDHDLDIFTNVGTGTVVPDASVIISDPGSGVTKSGWGGCGQPPPPTTCAGGCDDGKPCTEDKCENGSCTHTPITQAKMVSNGCRGCNNGTEDPPDTDAECCGTVAFTGGFVVCCNGQKTACAGSSFNGTSKQVVILRACALAHERAHFPHVNCPTGANECDTTRPPFRPGQDPGEGECEGSKAEVSCLQSRRGDCGGDAACEATVDGRITQIKAYGNSNMAGCFP